MIRWMSNLKVYLYHEAIDMRKQRNGLLTLIQETLTQDPQSEQLFLFYNKGRDKLKGLLWHRNGFLIIYKVLEKGRYELTDLTQDLTLNAEELSWVLMGFDFRRMKEHPELRFENYY